MEAKKRKTFSYGWSRGYVAEEAQVNGRHHLPTLQLLKYTEGEAAGAVGVRFCRYGHSGIFRRSPLLMSTDAIDMIRVALRRTPELRKLLMRLLDE